MNANIVSLRPQVSYELKKRGVAFRIPDDFYPQEELLTWENLYFDQQLLWFGKIDRFLNQFFSYAREHSLKLASGHYLRLKYLVDDFVLRCKILRKIIEQTSPTEIFFEGYQQNKHELFSIFDFTSEERASYRKPLKLIAEQTGIQFHANMIPKSLKQTMARTGRGQIRKIARRIKNSFFYNFPLKLDEQKKLAGAPKILVHQAGTPIIDAGIKKLSALKARVYLAESTGTWEPLNSIFSQPVDISSNVSELSNFAVQEAAYALDSFEKENVFFDFYDKETGVSSGLFLKPYFRNFLSKTIPETLQKIELYRKKYREEKIDAVVSTTFATLESSASLLAARLENIPSICFQHGFSIYDFKALSMTEMGVFDFSLVSDAATQAHFSEYARLYSGQINCKVFNYSPYYSSLKNKKRHGGQGNRILYYCTKMGAGIRCLNTMTHLPTWYFEYLTHLINWMGKRSDFIFTFKFSDDQEWGEQSIIPYIQNLNFSNVVVEKKPFVDCFDSTDRVILDYASTGSYEAAAAGIPMLILSRGAYSVQPEAEKIFRPVLRYFKTPFEALEHMEVFLSAQKDLFKVNLPLNSEDENPFVSILNSRGISKKGFANVYS